MTTPRPLPLALCALAALLTAAPAAAQRGADAARQGEDDLDALLRRFGPEAEELRGRIVTAIDRGVEWLLGKQQADGHWTTYESLYPLGGTALCALAVKKTMLGLYDGSPAALTREIRSLESKEKRNRISPTERIRLEFLKERGEAEIALRARCGAAVEKAIDWIREKYKAQGGAMGGTVDPRMAGMAHRTYDVGVVLMLLEAHATAKRKVGGETIAAVDPRLVAAGDRAWIQEMVDWLATVVTEPVHGGKRFEGRGWRYPGEAGDGASVDNSNTQYAVLGLKAASRMGIRIKDPRVWRDVAEYFITSQEADGPVVGREPPGMNPATGRYVFPRQYQTTQPDDKARGWGYLPEVDGMHPVTGAMTTAGLAALVTAQSELYEARVLPRDKDLDARIQKSIADGMAWLGLHFSVEKNPTANPNMSHGWHYYYLYGLERAGVLCQTEHFGKSSWYLDGARYLLGQQKADGSWSESGGMAAGMAGGAEADSMVHTAFAVLFLKRGTVPVKVPPVFEVVITEGD